MWGFKKKEVKVEQRQQVRPSKVNIIKSIIILNNHTDGEFNYEADGSFGLSINIDINNKVIKIGQNRGYDFENNSNPLNIAVLIGSYSVKTIEWVEVSL